MSQSTYIVFYSTMQYLEPRELLEATLHFLDGEILDFTRYSGPDTAWADRFSGREGPDMEFCLARMSFSEVLSNYQPEKLVAVDVLRSPWTLKLRLAVTSRVSEDIRGNHVPHNLTVSINPHDIFEAAEVSAGQLFARASISVNFWGYDVPIRMEDYRKEVKALAEFNELARGLSAIFGAIDCAIYMSI